MLGAATRVVVVVVVVVPTRFDIFYRVDRESSAC